MREVSAVEAEAFERQYRADPDPWDYDSSAYERVKYAHTLDALPRGPIGAALELGCSNGAFTAMLAERCQRLRAVDFSSKAVRLARRRVSTMPSVVVEEGDLRLGLPEGPFDAIVCSEVLYYWRREDAVRFCAAVPAALRPAGCIVAVHWRGVDPDAPQGGDAVHELMAERFDGALAHVRSETRPGYRLDRWDRSLDS